MPCLLVRYLRTLLQQYPCRCLRRIFNQVTTILCCCVSVLLLYVCCFAHLQTSFDKAKHRGSTVYPCLDVFYFCFLQGFASIVMFQARYYVRTLLQVLSHFAPPFTAILYMLQGNSADLTSSIPRPMSPGLPILIL